MFDVISWVFPKSQRRTKSRLNVAESSGILEADPPICTDYTDYDLGFRNANFGFRGNGEPREISRCLRENE
jgi:hypothetical protein